MSPREARVPVATGGCQCGAIRYAFYAPLQGSHACHCRMCQRATGGLFAALVGAKPENFAWTRGTPKFFASSNLAKRGYCADCGTPLSFKYDAPGSRMNVTIGSLDDPEQAPVESQMGVESRLSWVKFNEGLPEECTGASPQEKEFFASMQNHQRVKEP
jgi:hypothetical protein